ncbi:pyridoxamine 5'-phosphate oxidase family protein [Defluviimonas sp. WL0002]|uniref:Pyridoxamine 5'-phosphate oxidase family protein n=1 Tax=Albidovulum marisflavi TaxID=2984159 RepID=A0ABT2ZEC6_9RHOB|nr:pyridoxamine 5'-phosphate oxidase family protein [Defluviimonas sp. WL0002]MCV2869101.1 pyridoxamine 5'-phosphate oxidase family protein [Defluviimonas sp. WL0002]
MTLREKVRDDPRATLFDVMEDQRTGMLGIVGSEHALQPMVHFADRDKAEVWFISSAQTDLVRDIGQGTRAHHCVVTPNGEFYACLTGTLEQSDDRKKLDELWSAPTAAWFKGGRDDPDVSLLRLALQEAAVWTATQNTFIFGLEVARANIDAEHTPDVGEHLVLRFDATG